LIIEPPRWHRLAKRRFINGRWVIVRQLRGRQPRVRKLLDFERKVAVVGDISDEVVMRLARAGVTVIRK
jgi:hypothetical protein